MNFPKESWGSHPSSDSKQRRKRKFFTVVFIQVVKESVLDVQNLLFFHLFIGLIAVAVVAWVARKRLLRRLSLSPSSLLPGFIDVSKRLGI